MGIIRHRGQKAGDSPHEGIDRPGTTAPPGTTWSHGAGLNEWSNTRTNIGSDAYFNSKANQKPFGAWDVGAAKTDVGFHPTVTDASGNTVISNFGHATKWGARRTARRAVREHGGMPTPSKHIGILEGFDDTRNKPDPFAPKAPKPPRPKL